MVEAMRRHLGLGLVAMLASCAAFGTSGPFAKSLMTAGWTPGRGGAGPDHRGRARAPARSRCGACAGSWGAMRRELPRVALYGTLAVAAAQLGYFQAVSRHGRRHRPAHRVPRHRPRRAVGVGAHPPDGRTGSPAVGIVLALVGLALVLDVTGQSTPAAVRRAVGPARRRRAGRPLRARRPSDRHPVDGLRRARPDRRRAVALAAARSRRGPADGGRRLDRRGRRRPASRPGWPWPSWSSWPRPSPTCSASSAPASSGRPWRRSSASPRCSSRCSSPGCCSPSCPGVLQLVGGAVLLSGVVAVRLGERDLAREAGAVDDARRPI